MENNKKDKQFYLNYLKTKYALPKQLNISTSTTTNPASLISSLKERNFVIERIYDELIDEFASTLELSSSELVWLSADA